MKNPPAVQETRVRPPGREDPLEEGWMPIVVFLSGKSTDGGACMAAVLRVTKRQTQLRLTFEIDVNTRGNQWPSSLPSRKQEINLSCKRVTARIWRWKDPYCQNQGIYGESLYKQTWYFFKLPPQGQTLIRVHKASLPFSCQFLSNLLFLCLKKYTSCLLWPPLRSHYYKTSMNTN